MKGTGDGEPTGPLTTPQIARRLLPLYVTHVNQVECGGRCQQHWMEWGPQGAAGSGDVLLPPRPLPAPINLPHFTRRRPSPPPTQAILTTMPFTLAVYMVRNIEAAKAGGDPAAVSEAVVGRATGILSAVFCAAQLLTSYPLGMLSDRIGRKVGVRGSSVGGLARRTWGLGRQGAVMAGRLHATCDGPTGG